LKNINDERYQQAWAFVNTFKKNSTQYTIGEILAKDLYDGAQKCFMLHCRGT
jgi:hypothetical protein